MSSTRKQPQLDRRKNWRQRSMLSCAYAIALACGSGSALAAPKTAKLQRVVKDGGTYDRATHGLPRLVFLQVDAADWLDPELLVDPAEIMDFKHPARAAFLQAMGELNPEQLDYQTQPLSRLADGLGLDLALGQQGNLHIDLYQTRGAPTRGVRLLRQTPKTPHWSLGITVDTLRDQQGETRNHVVPQLLLDLDGLFGEDTRLQAALEYGHWTAGASGPIMDVRVAQAVLRLRF